MKYLMRNISLLYTAIYERFLEIIDDKDSRNKLTKLMHGYEREEIDISDIYNRYFQTE